MAVRDREIRKTRQEATESISVHAKSGAYGEVPLKEENRKVPVDKLQDLAHVARVRVEGSVTKNVGNYESVRVGVSIEWPCRPNEKSLHNTYVFLSQRVDELIGEELANNGIEV